MAQIIDIRRVEVGPRSLTARVRIATNAPLFTSEDLQGTARVYHLLPHIIEHTCLGDAGAKFKDVMGDTEIAHLLEHVTVELLAQSDIAGDISCGRTFAVDDERRTYDVEISCPDDVLVVGALSSAVWILQWAYTGGADPEPDVAATVKGLVGLVQTLPEPEEPSPSVVEYVISEEEAEALIAEQGIFSNEPTPTGGTVGVYTADLVEGLDEPTGVEHHPEPEPEEGVWESPEARQASQDIPAPHPQPDDVPIVAEDEPSGEVEEKDEPEAEGAEDVPDLFEDSPLRSAVQEAAEIPDAEFESLEPPTPEASTPEPIAEDEHEPFIEEQVNDEPVSEQLASEPYDEEPFVYEPIYVPQPFDDYAVEYEPVPQTMPVAEPSPEPLANTAPVAEPIDEPVPEAIAEPVPEYAPEPAPESVEAEPVVVDELSPEPEDEAENQPQDQLASVPVQERAPELEQNVEPEYLDPEPSPFERGAASVKEVLRATAAATETEIVVEEHEVSPESDEAEVVDENDDNRLPKNDYANDAEDVDDSGDDEGSSYQASADVSWSTVSPAATGEWGSIPAPKYVR